jgi:hypothetical protein
MNHVFSDPLLIGLNGMVGRNKLSCLLDSGASCNFISLKTLDELNIDYDLVLS